MFSSSKLKIVIMVTINENGNNSKSIGNRKRNSREIIVFMVRIVIVIAGMSTGLVLRLR